MWILLGIFLARYFHSDAANEFSGAITPVAVLSEVMGHILAI